LVARLRTELDDWVAQLKLPPLDAPIEHSGHTQVDAATRERLKALGYMD